MFKVQRCSSSRPRWLLLMMVKKVSWSDSVRTFGCEIAVWSTIYWNDGNCSFSTSTPCSFISWCSGINTFFSAGFSLILGRWMSELVLKEADRAGQGPSWWGALCFLVVAICGSEHLWSSILQPCRCVRRRSKGRKTPQRIEPTFLLSSGANLHFGHHVAQIARIRP